MLGAQICAQPGLLANPTEPSTHPTWACNVLSGQKRAACYVPWKAGRDKVGRVAAPYHAQEMGYIGGIATR